jgi:hypothetical protein
MQTSIWKQEFQDFLKNDDMKKGNYRREKKWIEK